MQLDLNFNNTNVTDKTIAEQALEDICEIISNQVHNAMLEVGRYLIKTFYGDDYDAAKEKKPIKKNDLATLNKLIKADNNSVMKSYSKSWLYNSVQYACDEDTFKSFHTYGNLLQSHKVLLFPIEDIDFKRQLIEEIADNNYTVKQLRERLAAHNSPPSTPRVSFTSMTATDLMDMKISDLKKFQKKAQKNLEAAEKEMNLYKSSWQTITMVIESKSKPEEKTVA